MKILYLVHQFYPEFWTGTEKVVLKIASIMQQADHYTSVVTSSFKEDHCFTQSMGTLLFGEHLYNGIPVLALKHKFTPITIHTGIRDATMTELARHILSLEKPDIIHVGHGMRVNEFLFLALDLKIPYIMTLTDFWWICPRFTLISSSGQLCKGPENGRACARMCPEFSQDFIKQRLYLARKALEGAQRLAAPSNFVANMFKAEFKDLNIEVINHGLSYNIIKKNTRRYQKGDKLIFSFAGSFSRHKGIHLLIEAIKQINSEDLALKIYGSGTDPQYTDELLEMAKGDRRIQFCGVFPAQEVGTVMGEIDILVIPSTCYETYSLILHEALACHVPTIVPNVGGMAEKVRDGFNGFTFQIGNGGSLKAVIENIITNPLLLNQVKDNLKYSLVNSVEQEAYAYHTMYNEVLRNLKINLESCDIR
jgi:glycosyltransferase involved in cell wall biosynthesis